VDQVVINSRNKNIEELYIFENKGVYLAGYVSAGILKSYTKLDPPVIIQPSLDKEKDSTISYMKKWNTDKKNYDGGIKTKSKTELKRKGIILINNKEEDFYLYELTISQDAIIAYGEQGLIVPEAIILKSNILYGDKTGLVAEWGIRSKKIEEETKDGKQELENYLELNKYYMLNRGGVRK
jgi:hypothetical protein